MVKRICMLSTMLIFLITISSRTDIPLETTPSWQWDSSIGERAVGAVAWGDVDGDGDLDLAVGCYDGSNWYPPITEYHNMVFINNNGVLETTNSWVSDVDRHTGDMAFMDVNDDGYQDLVCANGGFSFHNSCIYYGSSSGLSTTPDWNGASNYWTTWIFCGDVNKDGWIDLVEGNQGVSPDPYRYTNIYYNSSGTLSTSPNWQTNTEFIASGLYLGDVGNDGQQIITDYSLPTDGTTRLFYLPEKPLMSIDAVDINGSSYDTYCYDLEQGWLSLATPPGSGDTLTVDYTYTNEPDLAVAKWVNNFVTGIYFHNGTDINNTVGWDCGLPDESDKGIAFLDVNIDGQQDLLIGNSGDPTRLYINDGGYYETTIDWEESDSYYSCGDLAFGDVDNDGDMDLAIFHTSAGEIRIYENVSGTLNTTPDWLYDTDCSYGALAWGDVDKDGDLDLAVGVSRDPAMIFFNTTYSDIILTTFNATPFDKDLLLRWEISTTMDEEITGFNLYRREISPVRENHNSPLQKNTDTWIRVNNHLITGDNPYSYLDDTVESGITYEYKLEAVVEDTTETIGTATGTCGLPNSFAITSIHPNPATDEVSITLSIPESGDVMIEVYDITGRVVMSITLGEIETGEHSEMLSTSDLSSGVYTIKAIAGVEQSTKKMVVVR